MNGFAERDLDRFAGILDHCDRIEEILARLHHSREEYNADPMHHQYAPYGLFCSRGFVVQG